MARSSAFTTRRGRFLSCSRTPTKHGTLTSPARRPGSGPSRPTQLGRAGQARRCHDRSSAHRGGTGMISRRRMLAASAAALALAVPNGAFAQALPDKPIRIIVAVAPGGPMDSMARFIAPLMQDRLGQPVIVENRPGAGTTIAAKAVAQAEPDGTTLLWGTLASVAIAPAMYKDLEYDPKGFVPVAMIAEFPMV